MEQYGRSISLSQAPREPLENTSDEDDEELTPTGGLISGEPSNRLRSITSTSAYLPAAASGGGEVSNRKPRGRPPGSKNKPKPPIILTREMDSGMRPAILEIAPGSEIIDSVVEFARRRHLGVTILSGSGSVSTIAIRHPGSPAPALSLHGPFNILSLTGTYLGYNAPLHATMSSTCFGICLAGVQGQVFGGIVAGKAIAGSQVVLVASTFVSPAFHHLPADFERPDHEHHGRGGGGGGGGGGSGGSNEGCSRMMSLSVYGVAAPMPLNSCESDWGAVSRAPY